MNAPITNVADRQRFIGGSDAAGILGVSPWATPLDVYFDKIGKPRAVDPMKEKIFKRGKRMEPVVLEMLQDEYRVKVTKCSTPAEPNYHVDAEHPFLASEIDFEWEVTPELVDRFDLDPQLIGTPQNGEIKTCHPFASGKFGEAETDEIPVEYAAQAMHGLMIARRKLTMFGVLVGSDQLSVYWINRDDETIAGIRVKEVGFWHDNVIARVPPPPANLPDVMRLFRKDAETSIEADEETMALYLRYCEAKEHEKATALQLDELKFEIGRRMLGDEQVDKPSTPGKHILTKGGQPLLTVRYQEQTRIDSDLVRKLHPDVASACSKKSSFFTYNLPRGKK